MGGGSGRVGLQRPSVDTLQRGLGGYGLGGGAFGGGGRNRKYCGGGPFASVDVDELRNDPQHRRA